MKRRILAFLLATLFVLSSLSLAACDNKPSLPDEGDGTSDGDSNPDTTKAPVGTDEPEETTGEKGDGTNAAGLPLEYFDDYVPDSDAKFAGKVGVSGTGVSFDKLTVKIANKSVYENDFESSADLPEGVFSTFSGALSDWSVGNDTVTEGNKCLTPTGDSILTFGNNKWTSYRFTTSVCLGEDGVAKVIFCAVDESNYYMVTVGAKSDPGLVLTQVKDGKSEKLNSFATTSTTGEWYTVSVNVTKEKVTVFVNGMEMFRVGGDAAATPIAGKLGFSQWQTEVYIDDVTVENLKTGDVIYSQDFEDGKFLDNAEYGVRNGGAWSASDNSAKDWEIVESPTGSGKSLHFKTGTSEVYGASVLFDAGIPDGTEAIKFTVHGYRAGGATAYEAWPAIWNWQSASDYLCFNIGGWSGKAAFQVIAGGTKTNKQETADTIGIVDGQWQTLELYIYPNVVYAAFEGKLIQVLWLGE